VKPQFLTKSVLKVWLKVNESWWRNAWPSSSLALWCPWTVVFAPVLQLPVRSAVLFHLSQLERQAGKFKVGCFKLDLICCQNAFQHSVNHVDSARLFTWNLGSTRFMVGWMQLLSEIAEAIFFYFFIFFMLNWPMYTKVQQGPNRMS